MTGQLGSLEYFFRHAWDFDVSVILGCAALLLIYGFWAKVSSLRSYAYILGVVLLFLSLTSPLDALSDEYLFSAHMLQHFILLMIVPPLMILGLPEEATRQFLSRRWIFKTQRILSNALFAWFFANVILWVWHLPLFYDLATRNENIHIFQHLTFLISATIFWWVILAPTHESRLPFAVGMTYLFLAGLSNMVLGVVLTFLNEPLYDAYKNPEDSWKILKILRAQYQLTPLADQRLGGAFMWILGSMVFLGVILIHLGHWYKDEARSNTLRMEKV